MSDAIRVVTHIHVQAGKAQEAITLLSELVMATRTETGCLRYELLQSSVVATEFVILEEWKSEEDINQHMQTPYVQEALLEGEMFLISPPDIQKYDLIV